MNPRLQDKTVVITGAGRGLGKAMALAFASEGAQIVLAARTPSQLQSVAHEIEEHGGVAHAIETDVRELRDLDKLVAETLRAFHRFDILINNAGAFQIRSLEQTSEELWDRILDTNLKATFFLTQKALPHLLRSQGHIVNIASVAARQTYPGNAAYCAAKSGIVALTNVMREELGPKGIRVTAVLPGAIDTPIWDEISGDWDSSTMMRPEAVAQTVVAACCQSLGSCVDEIVLRPFQSFPRGTRLAGRRKNKQ